MERALIRVSGDVQGVGFRWWAANEARRLGLVGYAENLPDGRVEISVQGDFDSVQAMIRRAVEVPTTTRRPGRVRAHDLEWATPNPILRGFSCY